MLCCAGLLVTRWAAARGTGCFESLLKSHLRAVWTGLHFKRSSYFILICLVSGKLQLRFTLWLGPGGPS